MLKINIYSSPWSKAYLPDLYTHTYTHTHIYSVSLSIALSFLCRHFHIVPKIINTKIRANDNDENWLHCTRALSDHICNESERPDFFVFAKSYSFFFLLLRCFVRQRKRKGKKESVRCVFANESVLVLIQHVFLLIVTSHFKFFVDVSVILFLFFFFYFNSAIVRGMRVFVYTQMHKLIIDWMPM